MLTETAALLPGALGEALLAATRGTPLAKPPDHKGGPDTDMFELALAPDEVGCILEVVEEATRRGRTTPRSRKLGGFVAAWRELGDWQARRV